MSGWYNWYSYKWIRHLNDDDDDDDDVDDDDDDTYVDQMTPDTCFDCIKGLKVASS